jgi:hypothetical protein
MDCSTCWKERAEVAEQTLSSLRGELALAIAERDRLQAEVREDTRRRLEEFDESTNARRGEEAALKACAEYRATIGLIERELNPCNPINTALLQHLTATALSSTAGAGYLSPAEVQERLTTLEAALYGPAEVEEMVEHIVRAARRAALSEAEDDIERAIRAAAKGTP